MTTPHSVLGMRRGAYGLILGILAGAGTTVCAQDNPAPEEDQAAPSDPADEEEPEIVVRGELIRGRALGGFQPEQVLTSEDIAAYGAGSLGELVDLLLAETSSGRGRASGPPIVLINGRRVSGFREVGRYPVSAVARVEVLPEEASLAYGFAADQRVLNFVLKRNVTITTLTLRGGAPTGGGRVSGEVDGQFLKVDGADRFSLDGAFEEAGSLLEAERDVVFSDGSSGALDRTIVPEQREASAGFSASVGLPAGSVATLSGSALDQRSKALFGSDPVSGETLAQTIKTSDRYAGLTVASGLGRSTWTLTASYSDLDQRTRTDLSAFSGLVRETDLSRTRWDANALLNQRLADLAAGPMTLTASFDLNLERQNAVINEGALINQSAIDRDTFGGRLSLDVPILAPAPLPGDFGVNLKGQARHLSDFVWLTTFGYGLRWRPVTRLRLLASVTHEEGAPPLNDLGAPEVVTPDVRTFDFATGEDVLATLITGGNRELVVDTRRVLKLGVQWNPNDEPRLGVNIDYTNSRIDNEVRRFALLTEDFESAFPDRVLRSAQGQLLAFDIRPLQVERGLRDELRTAITFSKRLKTKRRRRAEGPPAKRRRSGRPGSLRINAIHRLTLRDEARLGQAGQGGSGMGPVLDLLNGASIERVGGTPRHQVDLSVYRWKSGFGLAASARYQSATRVDNPSGDLRFSDLATLNLRATYEFNYSDKILASLPFLEETQMAFNVRNLFNQRQRVTDLQGQTPDNFLPELLDPLGRSVRLDIRKRF
ncbi:MAG: hypothetical protein AAF650_02585 [Pseudomonadota bacterium]